MTVPMKTCPQCGTEYEATLAWFYKFKSPDGLYPRCKACYKAGRGKRTATVAMIPMAPAKKPTRSTKKPAGKTAETLMAEALARHDANIATATAKPALKRSPRRIVGSITSGTADLD